MARPIVLSNGELHVGIDRYGLVHDFYYPYVGFENHSAAGGMRHKVGVWIDGTLSWLDDGNWSIEMNYAHESLIGFTRAINESLQICLELEDCVDSQQAAFIRNIHVINLAPSPRKIHLYLHQVFRLSNNLYGGTVQYLPGEPAILHYKGRRAFMIGAEHAADKRPFDEFSVGLNGIEGHDGTYRDAEDGHLSGNYVEHGKVDSILGAHLELSGHDSARVSYWIAVGKSQREAAVIYGRLKAEGAAARIARTHKDWQLWLKPAQHFLSKLPEEYQDAARNSLLIIKAHTDKRGAVIASTDTTVLNQMRDAYAYCWPRDASFVLWPLVRMGYKDEPLQFFSFCRRVVTADGYLMHKYQPDGALGSSWHPYVSAGHPEPPIQEDETAIVLFLFGEFYDLHSDKTLLDEYYDSLVKPMADFLSGYVDDASGLPHPSYDLWEEVFMTTTYTTAVTYGALIAAVKLAEANKKEGDAVKWRAAADDIRHSAHEKLWNKETKFFYKGLLHEDGETKKFEQIDMSAFYGAFMFGLYDLKSEELLAAVETIDNKLTQPGTPGYVRYEGDNYYNPNPGTIGNPWFVTTLWRAQLYLEVEQVEKANHLIDWVKDSMLSSGVLPEQVRAASGAYLSVAPLAWSQAEFLSTLLDLASGPETQVES